MTRRTLGRSQMSTARWRIQPGRSHHYPHL